MSDANRVRYRMIMGGMVEIRSTRMPANGDYPAYNEKTLCGVIEQVKGQREIYKTQAAYDEDLEQVEGALEYLLLHTDAAAPDTDATEEA